MQLTLPEFIKHYVSRDFNAKYVDTIANDMIDVMTGNKAGNSFEIKYSDTILKAYEEHKNG